MSNREKIIVFAAFAAVLYGVYEYFFSAKPQIRPAKTAISQKSEQKEEDTSQYLLKTIEELRQEDLTDTEEYIIGKTEKKWEDIFVSAPLPKPETPAEKEAGETKAKLPVYNGYLHTENGIIVIMDGIWYKEGEVLSGTGYKLIHVSQKEISLQTGKKEFDSIPIADEVERRYCISPGEITVRKENFMPPAADKIKGFYENSRKN